MDEQGPALEGALGTFGLERVGRNLKVCPPAQLFPKEKFKSNKAISLFLARQGEPRSDFSCSAQKRQRMSEK